MLDKVLQALFDILATEVPRTAAFATLNEIITRLSTKYNWLSDIRLNDTHLIQGADLLSIGASVNAIDHQMVGEVINRVIKEVF